MPLPLSSYVRRAQRTINFVYLNDEGASLALTQGGRTYYEPGNGQPGLVYVPPTVVESSDPEDDDIEFDFPAAQATPVAAADSGLVSPPLAQQQPTAAPLEESSLSSPGPNATDRASSRLSLHDAHSPAARAAILGKSPVAGLKHWFLEDVLIFEPNNPPSCLRKSSGSQKAFFIRGEQVKERWRCTLCGKVRTVDPKITNVLHRHYNEVHKGSTV
ncbi:unnamed protein product [Tilletia laevis]|uniref:Uncharacterized protein n=2 Tax=Tilletia TaxID=13289 RepID=A0A9N8M4K3_9BASI|nr:hypothetical protein CF335_g6425 [Tilletia laevis]CAD6953974.1 unnamed protein product [Tilletia caries]CAD6956985.1 unnamed protein product [Tilletia laevis]CAD6960910.1 unnamed protein product [Tilletia laevis]CAD6961108.1 unnamed protein product [Tilletia caries]